MSEPIKRDGEEVKQQVITILDVFQRGFKEKYVGDTYFDGYRAALDTLREEVEKIPTVIEVPQ